MATKVNLVVASGVHQGKSIAVSGPQFLIGRDPACNLRPASPAVSKKHTAIFVRDGKLFVKDLGSTNGTLVNDEPVTADRELADGDRLKLGPLDFRLEIRTGLRSSTETIPVKPSSETPTNPEVRSSLTPTAADAMPAVRTGRPDQDTDADAAAAMLLGMDDDDPAVPPHVPDGTTIHEMPAVDIEKMAAEMKAASDKKKVVPTSAETSDAASEILRKYMRRPK